MQRTEKTVFLSYRRVDIAWALAIFHHLTNHGYDAFFDFKGIGNGDFEQLILGNIKARAHFLVLLTPSALNRCIDSGDWLRREIETAIDTSRNIVPLMLEGFSFGAPENSDRLIGKLESLRHYNALRIYREYFEAAMSELRDRYLNMQLDAVLHPITLSAQQATMDHQAAAAIAPKIQEKTLTTGELIAEEDSAADPMVRAVMHPQAAAAIAPKIQEKTLTTGELIAEGDSAADLENMVAALRKKVVARDAEAMQLLGFMYETGRGGLPQDPAQAVSWYRIAADAGNGSSMNTLGEMYKTGRGGLPKDHAQAVSWYRKAADAGDSNGMNNLGFMYENGRGGLPKDKAQAVSWYRKSSDAGNELGKNNMKRLGY